MSRLVRIEAALRAGLAPLRLQVFDDSHLHAGHVGARDGRGHFRVEVVSAAFAGLPLLDRHRRVHGLLAELLASDIHALSIRALTPAEAGMETP